MDRLVVQRILKEREQTKKVASKVYGPSSHWTPTEHEKFLEGLQRYIPLKSFFQNNFYLDSD
jgi:hypothetical protein